MLVVHYYFDQLLLLVKAIFLKTIIIYIYNGVTTHLMAKSSMPIALKIIIHQSKCTWLIIFVLIKHGYML